jgi:hypothetical protein
MPIESADYAALSIAECARRSYRQRVIGTLIATGNRNGNRNGESAMAIGKWRLK